MTGGTPVPLDEEVRTSFNSGTGVPPLSSSELFMPMFVLFAVFCSPALAGDALTEYVNRPEPKFAWKVEGNEGGVTTLKLTSQVWHDIEWTHDVQIFLPKGAEATHTAVLWNQGGKPSITTGLLAMRIAEKIKAPVVFVFGIPNQPLFGGKKEDALIAETFTRALESGDDSWPLLLPMAKSLVKAMDAVEQYTAKEWKQPIKKFVVTGASKRGWTSWLTGVVDPRAKAIVPMVIDTLNMPEQMKLQVLSFGKPSEQIKDYTDAGLTKLARTEKGRALLKIVDPYSYRDKLGLPKLIINGTNDPYWPVDALNMYYDDLPGPKLVTLVPNAGHDLREKTETGGNNDKAIDAVAAFSKAIIFDKPLPTLTYTHDEADGKTAGRGQAPRGEHSRRPRLVGRRPDPRLPAREMVGREARLSSRNGHGLTRSSRPPGFAPSTSNSTPRSPAFR